ncbi:DUF3891 family protein [Aquimarina sp. W85]|uniref:DUF3891 family protein n=1 Tax=Aquimarina rhodophyticola TaxID=3342246 RepID=UPI00366DE43A
MIVNKVIDGWEIIYHYAHGLLAGQIAQQITHAYRPKYWIETLTAIIEHDDNQLDFKQKKYLDSVGAPLDFELDIPTNEELYKRASGVLQLAAFKSGWIMLLVSMHVHNLYHKESSPKDKLWNLLQDQIKLRKTLRRRYGISVEEAEAYYNILLFCDRCSLLMCQNAIPSQGRAIEINKTINNEQYFIKNVDQTTYTIEPWCFERDSFEVAVESRTLTQLKFNNNRELQKALAAANVKIKKWNFKRS